VREGRETSSEGNIGEGLGGRVVLSLLLSGKCEKM